MNAKENHSKPLRALINLLLTSGALLFALLLAEGALRADAYVKNGFTQLDSTFMIDGASGLRVPRPAMNYKGIHINALGFRGPEITSPKPANTIRLAFLGASTTFCAEVSNDSTTWPDMVTRDFNRQFSQSTFDYMHFTDAGSSAMARRITERLAVTPEFQNLLRETIPASRLQIPPTAGSRDMTSPRPPAVGTRP